MNLTQGQLRGHLAMLLFSALVAGSFSLGSVMANEIAPVALMTLRFFLAALVMASLSYAAGGLRRAHFAAPWRYLVLGGLFATYFVLMFEGLKTADAVSTSAVFTLVPLMSAVFGYFLLRQITTNRMALALGVAALGALWIIFRADFDALLTFDIGKGELIYFIGCFSHAIYTPMVRKLNRGEGALVFTFGTLVGGFLFLAMVGVPEILKTDWIKLPTIVWITLLYLVVFATAVSFVLLQYAILRLPAAKVMAYSYLTPAWVILWEAGLGNGLPGATVLLGVVLVIAALLILLKDEAAA